jgi:hypothetical protein
MVVAHNMIYPVIGIWFFDNLQEVFLTISPVILNVFPTFTGVNMQYSIYKVTYYVIILWAPLASLRSRNTTLPRPQFVLCTVSSHIPWPS